MVLINIYCVAGYFDNVQNVLGGALRGVGINQAPAAVYLICDSGFLRGHFLGEQLGGSTNGWFM